MKGKTPVLLLRLEKKQRIGTALTNEKAKGGLFNLTMLYYSMPINHLELQKHSGKNI